MTHQIPVTALGTSTNLNRYLPPEILLKIFRDSSPSSAGVLGNSMINTHESGCSEEYEIKRNIVGVCRLWCNVGTELLYDEVVIRQIDNLAALLRTLRAPDSNLGRFIKKMVISCVVPFGDNTIVFEDTIKRIITHCPLLSHLFFDPSFHPIGVNTESCDVQLHSLRISQGSSTITHLDWGSCLLFSDLVLFVQHCPNIESLQFHLRSCDLNGLHDIKKALDTETLYPESSDLVKALDIVLVLPNLRELRFVRSNVIGISIDRLDLRLGAQWSMPQLQRFTYVNTNPRDFADFADIAGFCQIHGRSLRYLQLGPDWRHWNHDDTVQEILDECPLLEHLVLWMSTLRLDAIYTLSHPNIMWVDMWVDMSINIHNLETFAQAKPPNLSSLRRMRLFDRRLWRPYTPDLPTLLPPETATLEDGFRYKYSGFDVYQKDQFVFPEGLTILSAEGTGVEDEDEDEGSDFDPSTIASYDDTSSFSEDGSDEDSSASLEQLDVNEEIGEWQLDSEAALAVFSSILDA